MMFLNCPAYLDQDGGARCGLPAKVGRRFILHSTDGPLESASIRCPVGHHFNGPIESLTGHVSDPRDLVGLGCRNERGSLMRDHDGRGGHGGRSVCGPPAKPDQDEARRTNITPADALGHPGSLSINALRTRPPRTAFSAN